MCSIYGSESDTLFSKYTCYIYLLLAEYGVSVFFTFSTDRDHDVSKILGSLRKSLRLPLLKRFGESTYRLAKF